MDTSGEIRRIYLRDPQGTTTGGQFTANPSGAQASLTYQHTEGDYGQYKGRTSTSSKAGQQAKLSFRTLRPGAQNDPATVKDLQRLLSALGFITGGLQQNGVYDEATAAAVKLVQAKLGQKKPSGVADRSLINQLLTAYDLTH